MRRKPSVFLSLPHPFSLALPTGFHSLASLRLNSEASRESRCLRYETGKGTMHLHENPLYQFSNIYKCLLALPEHNFSLSGIGSKIISATLTSVQVARVSMVIVSSFTQHCTIVQGGNASLN